MEYEFRKDRRLVLTPPGLLVGILLGMRAAQNLTPLCSAEDQ